MTPNADPIAGLRDQLTALLWQVYGYPGALSDAHPVTQEKYRADAAAVLEVIEGAGYELHPARLPVIEERREYVAGEVTVERWQVCPYCGERHNLVGSFQLRPEAGS